MSVSVPFSFSLFCSVFSFQCLMSLQRSSQWNQQPLPQSWCSGRYFQTSNTTGIPEYTHNIIYTQTNTTKLWVQVNHPLGEWDPCRHTVCMQWLYVGLCCVTLEAIIIIYWTTKGQRAAQTDWRDGIRERWTDGETDSLGWGKEMIKILMRIYEQERY